MTRVSPKDLLPFPAAAPAEKPAQNDGRIVLGESLHSGARILVASSPALLSMLAKARQIARSKVPVLIEGETGTGKELIARLIHEHSPRRGQRFVQVNCAAFSDTLIESELFGHERGAFTGADQRHCGYFERANLGSLLLDEIGEMPLKLQAKLLRVLEEEAFERLGGEEPLQVNVRIVATTNRNLESEIGTGQFRADLFYRLNAVTLQLPPLRARPEEIPSLVQYFLERFADEANAALRSICPKALALLQAYSWPGNIRQLRNVIQHACVLAEGPQVQCHDLPALSACVPQSSRLAAQPTLAESERHMILDTLREVGGNRTAAALRLGVTTRTLQNKLKLYREENAA